MDDIDMIILHILRQNARTSFTEIGEQLGMSRTAVKKRVRKLENDGIILGYKAVIDQGLIEEDLMDKYGGSTMIDLNEKVAREMNKYLDGITIEKIISGRKDIFHYKVMFSKNNMANDIEVLNLSQRSYNCLKRAGVYTIGDLINNFDTKPGETSRSQLRKIRNLGSKSAEEIIMNLFYYHFTVLPEKNRVAYMAQLVKENPLPQ